MNKQQVKGTGNKIAGEVKQQVGRMTGDTSTTVRGQAQEIKGSVQQGVGNVRDDARQQRELEREVGREQLNRR
jgi:uncharacterized protein YjbJ (UPF0337 family)